MAHGQVTLKLQISLNWITMSSIWCFIISSTLLSFLIFLAIPNKSCVSHLLITISLECFLISSRISVITFGSTCNSFFYQYNIQWYIYFCQSYFWPRIYNMYWYWTLNLSRSLHRKYTMHSYIALITFTYRTYFTFSYWM